jgi:hypothetical protein
MTPTTRAVLRRSDMPRSRHAMRAATVLTVLALGSPAIAAPQADAGRPAASVEPDTRPSVAVRLIDVTGVPVAGAELSIVGTPLRALSDTLDAYVITTRRDGVIEAVVRRTGFRPVRMTLGVTRANRRVVDVVMRSHGERPPEIVLTPARAHAVAAHGRVPDLARTIGTPGADRGSVAPPRVRYLHLLEYLTDHIVYSAADVEVRAEPTSTTLVQEPGTPADRSGGVVVLEYVVDDVGRVRWESAGVIGATSAGHVESVFRAATALTYRPARSDGRPVWQLVQQVFRVE